MWAQVLKVAGHVAYYGLATSKEESPPFEVPLRKGYGVFHAGLELHKARGFVPRVRGSEAQRPVSRHSPLHPEHGTTSSCGAGLVGSGVLTCAQWASSSRKWQGA